MALRWDNDRMEYVDDDEEEAPPLGPTTTPFASKPDDDDEDLLTPTFAEPSPSAPPSALPPPVTKAPVAPTPTRATTQAPGVFQPELEAETGAGAALERKKEISLRRARLGEQEAAAEESSLAGQSRAIHEESAEKQEIQKNFMAKQARDQEEIARLQAEEEKTRAKTKTGWGGMKTGDQILAGLSIFLYSIGQGLSGDKGPNRALDIVMSNLDKDAKAKEEDIQRRYGEKIRRLQGPARQEAIEERDRLLFNARQRREDNLKLAGVELQRQAARSGQQDKILAAQEQAAQWDIEAENNRAKNERDRRDALMKQAEAEARAKKGRAGGGPGKLPTEAQGRAEDYFQVMMNEHQTLEQLPPLSPAGREILRRQLVLQSLYDKTPTVDLLTQLTDLNKTIQQKLSDQDRRAFAAASRFLDPVIRQRSGAVVTPAEANRYVNDYFPAVGDKEQDIADKRRARLVLLKGTAARTSRPQQFTAQVDAAPERPGPRPGAVPGRGPAPARPAPKQLTDEDRVAIKWAHEHPDDPNSERILALHPGM